MYYEITFKRGNKWKVPIDEVTQWAKKQGVVLSCNVAGRREQLQRFIEEKEPVVKGVLVVTDWTMEED